MWTLQSIKEFKISVLNVYYLCISFILLLFLGWIWKRCEGLRQRFGTVQGKPQGPVQEGTLFEGAWEVQGGLQLHHRLSAHF